jgi:hypothetical protein
MNTNKIIKSFISDFTKIKSFGFIKSHRKHNTGIGKTFEDLIGIKENNNLLIDYKGLIEIKSQRNYAENYITLFTKSPTYPKNANSILKDKFGYPDSENPEIKVLHTSIFYNSFNNCKDKFGFKLDILNNKINLIIKDIKKNSIISDDISWDFNILENIINNKCSIIAFVNAETKVKNNMEYFHFISCKLLSGFNFKKFISAIQNNDIMFDIRIGSYKSGINKGKPHDHGSGFRIHKNSLYKYFDIQEI